MKRITKAQAMTILSTHKCDFIGSTDNYSLGTIIDDLNSKPDTIGETRTPSKIGATFIQWSTGSRIYFESGYKYYTHGDFLTIDGNGFIMSYKPGEKIETNQDKTSNSMVDMIGGFI